MSHRLTSLWTLTSDELVRCSPNSVPQQIAGALQSCDKGKLPGHVTLPRDREARESDKVVSVTQVRGKKTIEKEKEENKQRLVWQTKSDIQFFAASGNVKANVLTGEATTDKIKNNTTRANAAVLAI
ncbi:hypothetical protein CBL_01639 [Carabus blaptoides fortunei]